MILSLGGNNLPVISRSGSIGTEGNSQKDAAVSYLQPRLLLPSKEDLDRVPIMLTSIHFYLALLRSTCFVHVPSIQAVSPVFKLITILGDMYKKGP